MRCCCWRTRLDASNRSTSDHALRAALRPQPRRGRPTAHSSGAVSAPPGSSPSEDHDLGPGVYQGREILKTMSRAISSTSTASGVHAVGTPALVEGIYDTTVRSRASDRDSGLPDDPALRQPPARPIRTCVRSAPPAAAAGRRRTRLPAPGSNFHGPAQRLPGNASLFAGRYVGRAAPPTAAARLPTSPAS